MFPLRRYASLLLSKNAVVKLKQVNKPLRIVISPGGCHGFSYDFITDAPTAEDEIIEQQQVKVLVDKVALDLVKGSTLDYKVTPMGAAFTLENPQAESSCGCGHSFSVKTQ